MFGDVYKHIPFTPVVSAPIPSLVATSPLVCLLSLLAVPFFHAQLLLVPRGVQVHRISCV